MDPSNRYDDKQQMGCFPLDKRISMQDERVIDGAADTATYGAGGYAEKDPANKLIKVLLYKNHQYSVDYRDIHKCPICYEMCSLSSFGMHMQQHRFKEPYLCTYCYRAFKTRPEIDNHLFKHSGNLSYKCLKCGSAFAWEQGVKMHISIKHGRSSDLHISNLSSMEIKRMSCLPLDLRTRIQEERSIDGAADRATDCNGGIEEKDSANKLIKVHSYDKHDYSVDHRDIHKCPICYETFSISAFRKHMDHHRFFEPYECKYCCRIFKHCADLKKHLIRHSGNYSYKCLKCSKVFSFEVSVKVHIGCAHRIYDDENQNGEQDHHQSAQHTSNSSSEEIRRPVTNQDIWENPSQLELRRTAPDGSYPSSHRIDSQTFLYEQMESSQSQNDTSDQNNVRIGVQVHMGWAHRRSAYENQNGEQDHHQSAQHTSNSSSEEIRRPVTNQDIWENPSQLELRRTAPDGSYPASHRIDCQTFLHEQMESSQSQNDTSDQNNVKIGKYFAHDVPFQTNEVSDDRHSEVFRTDEDLGNQQIQAKKEVSHDHRSPESQISHRLATVSSERQPVEDVFFSCSLCGAKFYQAEEIIAHHTYCC